ncbi:hypothetical protein [Streptomyces sp. Amel2xC10]|uniref:hypothetical protein n=1 Tax=Streptomyces sp. Amel2xC10 TaxID=1305826 RepID=UPI000A0868C7|nr:hypothetical protein [Streptomyces sp. Amel2xC10]SMF86468.1 hypothetical protein SAMN02745830_07178 [Streptomyces sp. Amel2xC10]
MSRTLNRRPDPIRHAVRRRDPRTGRFVKIYNLTYTSQDGTHTRTLPARDIQTIGRLVNRLGERGEAWDISVTDKTGADCTFDFTCFTCFT